MQEIKIADLHIPFCENKDISILCSGGADSSLLLYILMKHKKQGTIHIHTLANNERSRITAISSTNVIEKCIQLTGYWNVKHYISYAEVQDSAAFFNYVADQDTSKTSAYLYTAGTANPPKDVADSFCGPSWNTEQVTRDPNVERPIFIANTFCAPFTNSDKKVIKSLYDNYGVTDELFPLTRSCEVEHRIGFTGHCDACWWCKERKWAFGSL